MISKDMSKCGHLLLTTYIYWMSSQIDEKKNKKIVNSGCSEGRKDVKYHQ